MPQQMSSSCVFVWRGQKFVVDVEPSATLKELGEKLQQLTNVTADTLRLLVPMEKSSKLLYPFSEEHAYLSLEASSVLKGKSIRMMGVPKDEFDEVLQSAKADLRIAGFEEEERRLKQRNADRTYNSLKLPQGTYVFCDFRTLSLPGIELNPPASKALALLHKLASDPGIVAIMNKHRWRVGILSEMAPVGYVGVSPKCILGVNKNQGEEISLRLRTDDLKGFRKYESIKKTLLHELAHMVFSEHDANFYALDRQLNEEAATLDWSKSRGHTLSGVTRAQHYEEEVDINSNSNSSRRLGGQASVLPTACASSVNAAVQRLANTSATLSGSSEGEILEFPDTNVVDEITDVSDHGVIPGNQNVSEPDPDDCKGGKSISPEPHVESVESQVTEEVDPHKKEGRILASKSEKFEFGPDNSEDSRFGPNSIQDSAPSEPEQNDSRIEEMQIEHDTDGAIQRSLTFEPNQEDPELLIIQDPVKMVCDRLQNAIRSLKCKVKPSETGRVLQTLKKIIRNVIEHPDDMKFKKLRKGNPMIQRNIVSYKAAMDILTLIGFVEEVIIDELGKAETYLVLKRNDPGLLWLAKSSLDIFISSDMTL